MNITEQHVEIAAKMYEYRAAARTIFGDEYQAHMDDRAKVLSAVPMRDNCDAIVAGAKIIRECDLIGMDALLMMAAVVEMIEPYNAKLNVRKGEK